VTPLSPYGDAVPTVATPARPPLGDAALAGGLLLLGLANIAFGLGSLDPGVSRVLDAALLPVTVVPLAWRRIAPWPVFLVVAGSILVPDLVVHTGFTTLGEFLALDLALYTVAVHAAARHAVLGVAVSQVQFLVLALRRPDFQEVGAYVFWTVVTVGPWVAGLVTATLSRRNEALHLLAAEQAEFARQAIVDERARISRELHDVISHHVTLMVVQAAVADRLLGVDPGGARTALSHVTRAGRSAVDELELLLQVLRAQSDEAPSAMPPSLDRLPQLQEDLRAAGLRVDCAVEGARRELAPAVDASAYRIVQEALTNVLRHSGTDRATLRIRYGDRALELEVCDDGRATPGASRAGGSGLIGMRERALLHGGSFASGRSERGGFRVHVSLPVPIEVS
jgi:signal transduction histidine kinase